MTQLEKLQAYIDDIAKGAPFDPVEAIRALARISANQPAKATPAALPAPDDPQQAELLTEDSTRGKRKPKAEMTS